MAVQRRAVLRVACAYRNVSGAEVMVVAAVIPLDLLPVEMQKVFQLATESPAARIESLPGWAMDMGRGITKIHLVGLFVGNPLHDR